MINIIYRYLPYILIFTVIGYNFSLYFTHSLEMNVIYNSDHVYLPILYKSLFVLHENYSDWYGSPAPYYFPDMFIYFISMFITNGNHYISFFLFFNIELIIIFITIYFIYKIFYDKTSALYFSSVIVAIIYFIPSIVSKYQYMSVFHFGECIIGLIVLLLILSNLKNNISKNNYLILLVLSLMIVISDNIFILHFILPILTVLIFLWLQKNITTKIVLNFSLLFIFSIILGNFFNYFLIVNKSSYPLNFSLKNFFENLNSIIDIMGNSFSNFTFSSILNLISLLLVLISVFSLKTIQNKSQFTKMRFSFIYLIIMILGNIIALTLINGVPINERYMIPIFIFPIIFIPIALKCLENPIKVFYSKKILFYVLLILIVFMNYSIYERFKKNDFKSEYYPTTVKCLDTFLRENNINYGIGGYWQSKSINILSKNNILISQVKPDLETYLHVINSNWYRNIYDFALIEYDSPLAAFSPDKNKIIGLNGNPTEIKKCENIEILYYKYGLITNINNDSKLLKWYSNADNIYNKKILFNSNNILYESWSSAESEFRWSLNTESKIIFKIDEQLNFIKGELKVNIGTLGEQKIIIKLNDKSLSEFTIDSSNENLVIYFNPNDLDLKGPNILKFILPTARKPENSTDNRILGINLRSFEVK